MGLGAGTTATGAGTITGAGTTIAPRHPAAPGARGGNGRKIQPNRHRQHGSETQCNSHLATPGTGENRRIGLKNRSLWPTERGVMLE